VAGPYEYTPYLWLVLISAVFLAVVGVFAFRHRPAPGAVPFSIVMGLGVLWVLANGLGMAAADETTKIFWFQFETAFMLPIATAGLWGTLEYAGLGKWLTRRLMVLLAITPLVFVPLIFTNETHHLVMTRIWFDGHIRADFGPLAWAGIVYGYFLTLLQILACIRLFVISPRHRWIAGGLAIATFSIRFCSFMTFIGWYPFGTIDPVVLVLNFAMIPYALAVFRFRMFDVVPVARDTVIEGMVDGMMVVDTGNRIIDLNKTAQSILGIVQSKVIGSRVEEVLHAYPDLVAFIRNAAATQREMAFGNPVARWYNISLSSVTDRRGFHLGSLIGLRDMTQQKHAQALILDQQRTLAMLKERELLARELHDGVGQMFAAANLQVAAAKELLARGDIALVESCLNRLAATTQEAKESIREYLLGVKSHSAADQDLLAVIRRYLSEYSHCCGIHTDLVVPPDFEGKRIDSAAGAQLQPIIQEALTNVRKHSGASSARVIFAPSDSQVRVTIEDDGRGFEPEELSGNQGFGLRSMRGRAEAVGARLELNSTPGKGTRVIVWVPWQKEGHESPACG